MYSGLVNCIFCGSGREYERIIHLLCAISYAGLSSDCWDGIAIILGLFLAL